MTNIDAALKALNMSIDAFARLTEPQKAAVQKLALDLGRIEESASKRGRNVKGNRHA